MAIKLPSLEEMLEAGMHFGHKTFRWHPNMAPFIFDERGGIHIIDLSVTQEYLKKALDFITRVVGEGGEVLFVGTKRQVAPIIEEVASSIEMPYVVSRWPGGMLTNFKTVLKSLKRLSKLEELIQSPYATKKEKRFWKKRKELLEADFAGILRMVELPKVLFVVDLIREKTAVAEARKLGIPIVGVVDTNANPELVDYPIPANDDATGSVSLIVKLIGQAIQEGKKKMKARAKEQLAGAEERELPLSDGELLEQPEALRAEKEQEKVEGEEERAKHNIRSKTR